MPSIAKKLICGLPKRMANFDPSVAPIVSEGANGVLEHFDVIGYVVAASSLVTLFFMWRIYKMIADGPTPAKDTLPPIGH